VPETTAPGAGRPRVALLTPRFLPFSQAFIAEQLAHYARYEPEVFARERLNGPRFPDPRVFTLTPGGPWRQAEALLHRATGFSPTMQARMRRRGHRLLHAQFGLSGLRALPYQSALRVPLIVTFRGHDVAFVGGRGRLPRPWLAARRRTLFARASLVLAVSSDLARRLEALGAPAARVRVWNQGVRIPAAGVRGPRPAGARLRIVMAGRFVEKKGFEHGLEAAARAKAAGIRIAVTVAGAGPRGRSYRRLARALGIEGVLAMPGALPHGDLLGLLAEADVVLVPSVVAADGDVEGVPNVLKEAAARGVPIVATRHGGIPEAVEDGESALLVPERDAAAMAHAIERLAADPMMAAAIGAGGRARMQRDFDIVRQVARLEDWYDEVRAEARP
jgi:glycosyltransferase involved in cell wall biosynthesis